MDIPASEPPPTGIDPWEVLAIIPDALAILDPSGIVRYTNLAWQQHFSTVDFIYQALPVVLDSLTTLSLEAEKVSLAVSAVLAGEQEQHTLFAINEQLAQRHTLYIKRYPFLNAIGAMLLLQPSIVWPAVTAPTLLAIEDALRERERQFSAMAANLPGILYRVVLHDDGRIEFPYISADTQALTERGANERRLPGAHWLDRIHPDDQAEFFTVLRNSAAELIPFDLEQRVSSVPGQQIWVRNITRPHRQEDGSVVWDGMILDITAQKRVEQELQASIREKDALLQEVHHRVKNNLQVISSLLDLQSLAITDVNAQLAFSDSQRRVHAMALVHEQLYQGNTMAQIDFANYVRTLTEYLQQSYLSASNTVTITIDIEDIELDANTAIPCGLIINELVSNALKHAFPNNQPGEVRISCRAAVNQVTLSVSDSGIGLPSEAELSKTGALGLKLVATLARQLRATITLERHNGTVATLVFLLRQERRKESELP